MSELEKLANVAVKFEIEEKVYKVKALSILQIAKIRQSLIDSAKDSYKKDIADMVVNLSEKERGKYLLEALKGFVVNDDEINSKLMSREGILVVLSEALGVVKEVAGALLDKPECQDTLWDVYSHAMGIEQTPVTPETKETEVKEENGEPKNV